MSPDAPASPSDPPRRPPRERLAGTDALRAALAAGRGVPLVLVLRDAADRGDEAGLLRDAEARGARIEFTTANELRRLADAPGPVTVLGLAAERPDVPFDEALRRPGPAWLLAGLAFPGNIGFAIRTIEVAGACAVAVAPPLAGAERRAALRASMDADRFFPVAWTSADAALAAARAPAGGTARRIVAIEDTPHATAPWDADLTGPVLFVAGGERNGIDPAVLAACDATIRLPMRGFIPAYNVHAAIAAVTLERLRQEDARPS